MSGQKPSVNPLELRKQLLIAESEINRAHLLDDGQIMINGLRAATTKARSFTSLASIAGLLTAGVVAMRSRKAVTSMLKPSWFQIVVKGAKIIAPLWLAFRRRSRKENFGNDE